MMQKIKYNLLTLLVILMGISCADEPLPFDTFDEYSKGAFPRMTSIADSDFFLTDPDVSAFSFDVEYYSENNGAEVASHEWFVRHRRGDDVTANVSIAAISSGSFGTNAASGLPSASFAFSMLDALAKLGMTIDDVAEADDFIFDGFVTMNDGRVFGPDNTGGSVQGGAGFDGIFRFIKQLKCVTDLDGTFDAVSTLTNQMGGYGWDDCGADGEVWKGQLKIESICNDELIISSITEVTVGSDVSIVTLFDMSMGAYNACYGTTTQGGTPNGDAAATAPTIKFKFLDGILSYVGESQWGEIYTLTDVGVSADGLDLTIGWFNNYGEGAVTVISRGEDNGTWPAVSK